MFIRSYKDEDYDIAVEKVRYDIKDLSMHEYQLIKYGLKSELEDLKNDLDLKENDLPEDEAKGAELIIKDIKNMLERLANK